MFCRLLFVFSLLFFFRPLCCLFVFDIRILITPFVSSNSSWHRDKTGVFNIMAFEDNRYVWDFISIMHITEHICLTFYPLSVIVLDRIHAIRINM